MVTTAGSASRATSVQDMGGVLFELVSSTGLEPVDGCVIVMVFVVELLKWLPATAPPMPPKIRAMSATRINVANPVPDRCLELPVTGVGTPGPYGCCMSFPLSAPLPRLSSNRERREQRVYIFL